MSQMPNKLRWLVDNFLKNSFAKRFKFSYNILHKLINKKENK